MGILNPRVFPDEFSYKKRLFRHLLAMLMVWASADLACVFLFEKPAVALQAAQGVAKVAPPRTLALMGKTIAILPGHGGKVTKHDKAHRIKQKLGAEWHGLKEKNLTLEVAQHLKSILEARGARVLMSRHKDTDVPSLAQAQFANRTKADLSISIHFNDHGNLKAAGTESFYYRPQDKRLARAVNNALVRELGRPNRGVKRYGYDVVARTRMPSVLVEPLFISNREDVRLIKSRKALQRSAQAIATGIVEYFEIR